MILNKIENGTFRRKSKENAKSIKEEEEEDWTFPYAKCFLVDRRTKDSLNDIEQHSLWGVPKFLNYLINGLPVFKVDMIVWMLCFTSGVSLKCISVKHLEMIKVEANYNQ